MRLELPDAACDTQGCSNWVNLHDYPEALHDPCSEVVCHSCGPCNCEDKDTP